MADTRTYIRVHDGMPDHPKVDGLSDKAFRLLVTCWCWCSRHLTDGRMPAAVWKKRATPKARRELVDAGLAVLDETSVRFHDYLQHQRSAADVVAAKAAKGDSGSLGNHVRWHEDRGIVKPGCPWCPAPPDDLDAPDDGPDDAPEPADERSQDRSHMRSQERPADGTDPSRFEHDKRSLTQENFGEVDTPKSPVDNPATSGNGSDPRSQMRSHSDRETSPETSTEIEGTPSGGPDSGGSVNRHRADRYARERADDDLNESIAGLLEQYTGRPCSPKHAAAVRAQLLDGRQVDRPLPYVIRAIRENPDRFMPPPPPASPRHEPWMDVPPLGERDNGAVNARGRAAVDAAIAAARNRTATAEEADQP